MPLLETPLEILVVDDEQADIELVREHLEEAQFNVRLHVATDGDQALRALKEGPLPDLVLLDINMPGIDGLATLEAIRADPDLWHLRVMVLSTSDQTSDMDRSFAAHADAFFKKPADADGYRDLVRRIHDMAEAYIWQG